MKTMLFAAVLAAFTFTACEKTTLELPTERPQTQDADADPTTEPRPSENIAKWIASHYPDYNVGQTTLTQKFEELFYNVAIAKSADKKVILFDSNGSFVSIQQL